MSLQNKNAGYGCPAASPIWEIFLRHLFASGESLSAVLNSVHNLAFYRYDGQGTSGAGDSFGVDKFVTLTGA
jgi:queuine/archaeosine tRNA-ribosyltransferase